MQGKFALFYRPSCLGGNREDATIQTIKPTIKISVNSVPAKFDGFSTILDKYRSSLEAANRSPKTISWYLEILNSFHKFLISENRTKPVTSLGKEDVEAYILYLTKTDKWAGNTHKSGRGKLSPFSIQGHVRAIKAFFSWLTREQYIDANPLTNLRLPKVPKNLVKTLTVEQIKSLLAGIDRSTPFGCRYYFVLLLLLDTGARISELVNIKLSDIDFTKGIIKVTGKGQKERIVFLTQITRKELTKYVKTLSWSIDSQKPVYLFSSRYGDHMTVNCVQQYIRRLAKKAGLDTVKCSPHTFRHTFATGYLANGGSDVMLMNILGHSSLQTTQKYVHLQPQDIQYQHAKCSPVTRLFKDRV